MTMMTAPALQPRDRLASPELRRLVERIVRKRVPEGEVDDVVQTILCDAVAAREVPAEEEKMRRWLVGIARHKVADFYRKRGKAKHVELPEQLEAEPPEHEAREWARWADKQVEGNEQAKRTLGWMAREGGGEKLAHIAEDEQLPPAQVRQRVSRLRRMMRKRWVAELAAVAGVGAVLLLAWYYLRKPEEVAKPTPVPVPEITPTAEPRDPLVERGIAQRKIAMGVCEESGDHDGWHRCLKLLDDAAELDPEGDKAQGVQSMRERARKELKLDDSNLDQDDAEDAKKDAPAPTTVPTTPPPAPLKTQVPSDFDLKLNRTKTPRPTKSPPRPMKSPPPKSPPPPTKSPPTKAPKSTAAPPSQAPPSKPTPQQTDFGETDFGKDPPQQFQQKATKG